VPRSLFFEDIDSEVTSAVEAAIEVLRKITKSVTDITLPPLPPVLPVMGVEAYAYHSKWINESPSRYFPSTRDRIIGNAAGVKAEVYAEALRETNLLRRQTSEHFSDIDLLITPTMPFPAQTIARSKDFDPKGIRNVSPFNILGLPTISIPCGFTSSGLPIGLQISGSPFGESAVLALAHAYERETDWHRRRPKLLPA